MPLFESGLYIVGPLSTDAKTTDTGQNVSIVLYAILHKGLEHLLTLVQGVGAPGTNAPGYRGTSVLVQVGLLLYFFYS